MIRINDIRIINLKEKGKLICSSGTYVVEDKVGYYRHQNKIYMYAGSNLGVDYFIEKKDPFPKGLGKII